MSELSAVSFKLSANLILFSTQHIGQLTGFLNLQLNRIHNVNLCTVRKPKMMNIVNKSQRPQIGCLPYFYTWCGPCANLECRSEMCCTQLARNAGPKKITRNLPSWHHRTTLSGCIFATKACIDNRKKNC